MTSIVSGLINFRVMMHLGFDLNEFVVQVSGIWIRYGYKTSVIIQKV